MPLESQMLQLQVKHKALDDAFHEFHKIVQGTQDAVCLLIKEQREYQGKTDHRFDLVDKRFDLIDERFDLVNKRFESVDKRFESVNKRFESVDKRFDKIEETLIQIVSLLSK